MLKSAFASYIICLIIKRVIIVKEVKYPVNSLQKKIISDGTVLPGNILKVDSFLNHQIDISLLKDMGKDFFELFRDKNINKILTIEASGIAIACYAAEFFNVPVVFAKKGHHKNVGNDVYTAEVFSYTKGTSYEIAVSKLYIHPDDRILIIDDFLANGQAVLGLQKIIHDAGATLCGAGIAITKAFQPGEKFLIDAGIDVRSLAAIEDMSDGTVKFRD